VAVGVLDVVDGLSEAAVGSAVALVHGTFFIDCELDRAGHLREDLLRVLETGRHAVFGGFSSKLLQVLDGVACGETNSACIIVGISIFEKGVSILVTALLI
jgi:hypothetical protein